MLDPKTVEGHVTRIFSKLGLEPTGAITVACWRSLPTFARTEAAYSHSMVAGGLELMS